MGDVFIFTSLLALTLHALISALNLYGYLKIKPLKKSQKHHSVSIIIAARDEESNLPSLFESLERLTYPQEKMEIILVNDRSADKTAQLMNDFAKVNDRVRVMHVTEKKAPLTGKGNALVEGVQASSGDLLLFTDADCQVPPSWVDYHVAALEENGGMTGGFLMLDTPDSSTLFTRMQTLDWVYLCIVGAAWSSRGHSLSLFGNNMGISRKTYDSCGGFEQAGVSILEDFKLVNQVKIQTQAKVRLWPERELLVKTEPARSLFSYFHQRKRWAVGGRQHGWLAFFLLGSLFLMNLCMALAPFLSGWGLALTLFFLSMVFDFHFFHTPLRRLGLADLIKWLPVYKLYLIFSSLILGFVLLFSRRVMWKGRLYQ